jgi:hypothetical protein
MFGCEACETTSATFALATFPETEDPWMFERVFARMRAEETIPNARFEALMFDNVFPGIEEPWMFESAFPPPTKKEAVRFPVE